MGRTRPTRGSRTMKKICYVGLISQNGRLIVNNETLTIADIA
jgi:hypothetical protein